MARKRVPISLRKPPSPDAATKSAKDEVAPPIALEPQPDVAARVAEPEVAVRAAVPEATEPEVAARAAVPEATEPEVAARVAEPEAAARVAEREVAEPEVAARVAEPEVTEPEVTARAAEPLVVDDAPQRVAPEVPPASLVSANGRPMRAVTVYLREEVADQLVLHGIEQGRDAIREAIEASLCERLGSPSASVARAPFADTARPDFRRRGPARRLVARVGRWIDLGRALMTTYRMHAQRT